MRNVFWSDFKQSLAYLNLVEGTLDMPRVLLNLQDQCIFKLFYPRKGFSSSYIWPYSARFIKHSRRLKKRGILAPKVIDHFKILGHEQGKVYAVKYVFRPGSSLRKFEKAQQYSLILSLASFIERLHRKGIFFRGLHLDNVMVTETQDFALLDITSVSFSWFSCSWRKRARNLKHLVSYPNDKQLFNYHLKAKFIQLYLESAHASKHQQEKFLEKMFG